MTGKISRSFIWKEVFSDLCRPCGFNDLRSSKKVLFNFISLLYSEFWKVSPFFFLEFFPPGLAVPS